MQQIVLVTTTKIQPYIFGSNRLRENIGASYLVDQVTSTWPDHFRKIFRGDLIYEGGGNYLARFEDEDPAGEFTRALSLQVLEEAPNLRLAIIRQDITTGEKDAIKAAFDKLEIKKQTQQKSSPLLGLGVTRVCQSTGLPAIGITKRIEDDPNSAYPASAEIFGKIDQMANANQQLAREIPAPENFIYPYDFDNLGRSINENSFLAVVHADGNDMGKRVKAIRKEAQSDSAYIEKMDAFSRKLRLASSQALQATIDHLADNIHQGCIKHPKLSKLKIELSSSKKDDEFFLPIRPIVFGGDDVTFVCDGRLGIALARFYIQEFHRQTEAVGLPGGPATACAGIAIVKVHYPFARAYALAEQLSKSAKNYRVWLREQDENWDGSCLDWHFALSGLSGSIQTIREREYSVSLNGTLGSLIMRPVTLEDNPCLDHEFRSWAALEAGLISFQVNRAKEKANIWAGKRNKLKALRSALRQGENAVEKFLTMYQLEKLPDLGVGSEFSRGWSDEIQDNDRPSKYCGYFDALELADFYIPLKEKTDES